MRTRPFCTHAAPDSCRDCDGTAAEEREERAYQREILRSARPGETFQASGPDHPQLVALREVTAQRADLVTRLRTTLAPEDLQVIRDALVAYEETLTADLLDGTAPGHHSDTLQRTVRRAGNMAALIERATA